MRPDKAGPTAGARRPSAAAGTDDHGTAVVTVDDDGPGVPAAARATVFGRFARLEDARARGDAGGWGLGLAIAKAVVERHGGTIEVGDAPVGGARFTVRLPAAP
jgi:signal transduction histidine kinase